MILTDEQVVEAFGDPRPFIGPDGIVTRFWPHKILRVAKLPAPIPLSWDRGVRVVRFQCHHRLVERFEAAFRRVYYSPEAWSSIDDFGGCYEFRAVRGARRSLSRHSWGIAVDLDVADNPMGGEGDMNPLVVEAFEAEGFAWGGRFSGRRVDPMHFEFVDLARLA